MSHRIAIAGLGASAREIHLPAYKSLPALQVVGGCDPLGRAEHFSFPLFASVPEMLEKTKPDILAVVTPPDTHFALASCGLQADCHIFCEKPFMNSLEEADAIIALAGRAGREVVVNNQYRFMRTHRAAKEKIGSADFGDLVFLSMHQMFHVTEETEAGWRGQDPQRTAKEFGKIIGELDPAAAQARDERLRAELRSGRAQTIRQKFIPDLNGGLIARRAKLAGSLFVQPTIQYGDGRTRLDDLLAPGFVMAAATAEPMTWLSPESRRIWQDLGGEEVIVAGVAANEAAGGSGVLREEGSLFSDWLRANDVSIVVVRPDRYVFGGADNADQLNDLIRQIAVGLSRR